MASLSVGTICEVDPDTHEVLYGLWSALGSNFPFYSITGDNDDKHFVINEKMELVFRDFEKARTHVLITTVTAKIVAIVNGIEYELYSCNDASFNPASRYYVLTFPDNGNGFVFQLGTTAVENDYPNEDPSLDDKKFRNSGVCVRFAVLEGRNYKKNDGRNYYGIYIPKTNGSISQSGGSYTYTAFDPTPKYFLTEDTDKVINNGNLQFAYNADAEVTAIVPICSACSECITPRARVSLIDNLRTERGPVSIGGVEYSSVGGLFIR